MLAVNTVAMMLPLVAFGCLVYAHRQVRGLMMQR
jgi:hypothetical protein